MQSSESVHPQERPGNQGVLRFFLRKASSTDSQIDSLDGLRGLAVMFVVLSHLGGLDMNLVPGINFTGTGKVGVWLFFVLSAFLLTSQFVERSDRVLAGRTWLNYVIRRFFRIFPLYTVVLATGCLLVSTNYFVQMTPSGMAHHLLLMDGDDVFWTIPVEVKYYAVLPLVVLFGVCVLRTRAWLVSAAFLAGITAFVIWPVPSCRFGLGRYITVFLLGSYAAFLHNILMRRRHQIAPSTRTAAEVTAWVVLAAIVAMTPHILQLLTGVEVPVKRFHSWYTMFGALWTIVLLCALHGTGVLNRLLSHPVLRFLGVISFSVYLWHMPVANFVHANMGAVHGTMKAYSAFALVLLVSSTSYLFIERPLMRIRLSRKTTGGDGALAADGVTTGT